MAYGWIILIIVGVGLKLILINRCYVVKSKNQIIMKIGKVLENFGTSVIDI